MQRGEEASRVLNSPVFRQAVDDTRKAILEAWASLDKPAGDHAQDLHRMLKCLEKVERCLTVHMETGKIAAKEIEARSRFSVLRRA